jgi:nickel/cobalt exporter
MLANEVALRRGVMLSFVSAFLQAATAIVIMALVYLLLRGTSISMGDASAVPRNLVLCADHRLRRLAAMEESKSARRGFRRAASLSSAATHGHAHHAPCPRA